MIALIKLDLQFSNAFCIHMRVLGKTFGTTLVLSWTMGYFQQNLSETVADQWKFSYYSR